MDQNIKFISYDEGVFNLYPPEPAAKIIPDWYKNIPSFLNKDSSYITEDDIPSIKKCVPVRDYLTSGYVLYNGYQVNAIVEKDKTLINTVSHRCNLKDYVSAHPYQQCPVEMHGNPNHYFKIVQPWKIITPPGYSCLFYQPYYTLNEDYDLFPAIVDTDKHDDSVNFVGVAKKDFVLEPGDPLMVVLPFKRDDWKMEVLFEDYTQKTSYAYFIKKMWHGTYSRLFNSRKKFR